VPSKQARHTNNPSLIWHTWASLANMMPITKLLVLLLGSWSVAEFALKQQGIPGSVELIRKVMHHVGHIVHQHGKHNHGVELQDEHYQHWDFHDQDHAADGRRERFHHAMRARMVAVRQCHQKCGENLACHETCPKPWQRFKAMCEKTMTMAICHKKCVLQHLGEECHKKCPWPTCQKMVAKVKEAIACHESCKPGDRACHFQCPHPGKKFLVACKTLDKTLECHRECAPGDGTCHHTCPKLKDLWQRKEESGGHHHPHYGHNIHHAVEGEKDHHHEHHQLLIKRVQETMECHHSCGMNSTCHRECPKPFAKLHDKCSAMQPVIACHRACGRNGECHAKCPLPTCKWMAEKVQNAMTCHRSCPIDGNAPQCHHSCPKPMLKLHKKCTMLQKVKACHKSCGVTDQKCHTECPDMLSFMDKLHQWHEHHKFTHRLIHV